VAAGASYPTITLTVTVAGTAGIESHKYSDGQGAANSTRPTTPIWTSDDSGGGCAYRGQSCDIDPHVGATVSLTAQAFDAANNAMPSVVLTWGTSNASIAASRDHRRGGHWNSRGRRRRDNHGERRRKIRKPRRSPSTRRRFVNRVAITPASASLTVGQLQQFVAIAYDASNAPIAGTAFTWTRRAPTIAPLSTTTGRDGHRDAAGKRSATLRATATSNGTFSQATVTVTAPAVVTRVTVTPATKALKLGWEGTLSAQAFDSANNPVPTATFTWTTSSATIAKLLTTSGSSIDTLGSSVGAATVTATESRQPAAPDRDRDGVDGRHARLGHVTGSGSLPSHTLDMNLTGSSWSTPGRSPPRCSPASLASTTSGSSGSRVYATIDAGTADVRLATYWSVKSANRPGWCRAAVDQCDELHLRRLQQRQRNWRCNRVQSGTWTRLVGAPADGQQRHDVSRGSGLERFVGSGVLGGGRSSCRRPKGSTRALRVMAWPGRTVWTRLRATTPSV